MGVRAACMLASVLVAALVACASFEPAALAPANDGGAPEAGSAGDGSAVGTRFCDGLSPRPEHCWDFDEGRPVATGWSSVNATGGVLAVDPSTFRSPPGAASVRVEASAPDCAYATMELRLPEARVAAPRLSYAIWPGDARGESFAGAVNVSTLSLGDASGSMNVYVELGPASSRVHVQYARGDGGTEDFFHPFAIVPPGRWSAVALRIDAAAGLLTLEIEHEIAVTASVATFLTDRTTVLAGVGVACRQPAAAAVELHVDDVVFDPG